MGSDIENLGGGKGNGAKGIKFKVWGMGGS